MVKEARATYFANLVSNSRRDPKVLFETVSNILSHISPSVLISLLKCNNFFSFFVRKMDDIRKNVNSLFYPPFPFTWPPILKNFSTILLEQLTKITGGMKTSSSTLDILPTSLLKKVIDSTGPSTFYHLALSLPTLNMLISNYLLKNKILTHLFLRTIGLYPSCLFWFLWS